jgi:hypothetical protein
LVVCLSVFANDCPEIKDWFELNDNINSSLINVTISWLICL